MARTKASSARLAKVRRQSEREASAARLTMGAPSRLKRSLEQAGCESDEEDPLVIDLSSELSEEQLDVIDPHSPLKAVSKKRRIEGTSARPDFADAATMTAPSDDSDRHSSRDGKSNISGRTTPEPTAQTAPQSPFVPSEHTPPDRPSKAGGSGAKRPARHCAEDEDEDEQWTALIDMTTGKVATLSRSSNSATGGRQSSAVRILSMKQMPSPVDAASTAAWPETPLCKIIRQKYDEGKTRTPATVEFVAPDTLDSDDFALYEGLRPQSVDNRFGSDEVRGRVPVSVANDGEKHTPASQTGIAPDSGYYSDLRSSRSR